MAELTLVSRKCMQCENASRRKTFHTKSTKTTKTQYVFQFVTIKLFDKWGMSGIAERIQYLQNFYESARNETVKAAEKYLGGKVPDNHMLHPSFSQKHDKVNLNAKNQSGIVSRELSSSSHFIFVSFLISAKFTHCFKPFA